MNALKISVCAIPSNRRFCQENNASKDDTGIHYFGDNTKTFLIDK